MIYIEDHICDDLALSNVSSVTSYSPYHFGRLFYYIAETPLSEYIRKRKLSLSAMELQNSSIKVIDLAMKYGYESADSFTRAFTKQTFTKLSHFGMKRLTIIPQVILKKLLGQLLMEKS